MVLPADRTVFAFFEIDSPVSVHCSDVFFIIGVKWWTHVSSTVINWRKNSVLLRRNVAKHSIEMSPRRCFCSIVSKRCIHLVYSFLMSKFSVIVVCTALFKGLLYLLARPLLVDNHPIPFHGFSTPFLAWSCHLVDHCEVRLGRSDLNSSVQYFIIVNERPDSPGVESNSALILVGLRPFKWNGIS